jgi:hypothetical protein
MLRAKSWLLLGVLSASCVVPDVQVAGPASDDDNNSSSGGKSSSPSGGKSNSPSNGATGDVGEGGSPDNPGPTPGGTTSRAGSSSTAGGPATSPMLAAGKFCNDITVGGESVRLTLVVGTGSKKATFVADSGDCTPVSGSPCSPIPTGSSVPVSVLEGATEVASNTAAISQGESWIFLITPNEALDGVELLGEDVGEEACELGLDGAASPAAN